MFFNNKYNSLWAIPINDYKQEYNQELLFDITNKLKEIYNKISTNENIR